MCIEKVNEAQTPEEMRAEIQRLRNYDPIVRHVIDSADYIGLSAEDKYTCLAYSLLKHNHQLQTVVLESVVLTPGPLIIGGSDDA